jgi:hypothetical protein
VKGLTHTLAALLGLAALALQNPSVQKALGMALAAHPGLAAVLVALGSIAALYHDPKADSNAQKPQ